MTNERQSSAASKTVKQNEPPNRMRKIHIPEGCKNIVIFVHGFGVRWDSRGLFTDIGGSLPSDWGRVLFDFYMVRGKHVFVRSVSEQIKNLRVVYKTVREKYPSATIHFVAHSMGCVVLAMSGVQSNGQIILLAPPDNFGEGALEDYFKHYPGAEGKAGELVVPRKDGTITHIPYEFFSEMRNIDPIEEMWRYSPTHRLDIIQTTSDEVLGITDLSRLAESADITQLPADHNFTGSARQKLLFTVQEILSS